MLTFMDGEARFVKSNNCSTVKPLVGWHDETSLIAESQKPATDRRIMHKNTALVRETYR